MKLKFGFKYWTDGKYIPLELGEKEFTTEERILEWLLKNNFRTAPTKPGKPVTVYNGPGGITAKTVR
jgi:hypothetical protein